MHGLDESSDSFSENYNDISEPLFNLNIGQFSLDTANKINNQEVFSEGDKIQNFNTQNFNIYLNEVHNDLGKTTNIPKNKKTANKSIIQSKNVPLFKIVNTSNSNIEIYFLGEIRKILEKNKCPESIINKINPDLEIDCFSLSKTKTKTNELKNSDISFLGKKRENEKSKQGIKLENKKISSVKHTKSDSDNIIKKAKALFFKHSIDYINAFIKQNTKNKIELLYLDYKQYVERLKKDFDLELLNSKLKDFVSLNISEKYLSITNKEFNKNIIKDILEKEKENSTIINFLNMTFNDLIDIFLFKKTFNDYIKFGGFLEDLQTIAGKSDEEYFSKFILFSYNYENWFLNKKGRTRKKSN